MKPLTKKQIELAQRLYLIARYRLKGRWIESVTQKFIMKYTKNTYSANSHLCEFVRGRRGAEKDIMKVPKYAYFYSLHLIKDRWPEAEKYIMKDPEYAKLYTHYIYLLFYKRNIK